MKRMNQINIQCDKCQKNLIQFRVYNWTEFHIDYNFNIICHDCRDSQKKDV